MAKGRNTTREAVRTGGRIAAPLIVAGVLALAGCGGGGPKAASATANTSSSGGGSSTRHPTTSSSSSNSGTKVRGYDSCTMLTSTQVASALGEPPAAPKHEPDFDVSECEWDPASGHNGTVTVEVGPWEGNPGVKPLRLGTPVPALGDEAHQNGGWLYVRRGNLGIGVWVFRVDGQRSSFDQDKRLATILLTEL